MPRPLSPTLLSLQMKKDAQTLSDSPDISIKGRQKKAEKKGPWEGERKYRVQDALKGVLVPGTYKLHPEF